MSQLAENWPELQPLAHRIAVGELDGEEAVQAVIEALVAREAGPDASADLRAAIRAQVETAVGEDRVLTALLRPIGPSWERPPTRLGTLAPIPHPNAFALDPEVMTEGELDGEAEEELDEEAVAVQAAAYARAQLQRRMFATLGGGLALLIMVVLWWVFLRQGPCDALARQVCRELPGECASTDVLSHLGMAGVEEQQCVALRAEVAELTAEAESSERAHLFEEAMVKHLGFDARTGKVPPPPVAPPKPRPAPVTVVENMPTAQPFVVDEAFVYALNPGAVVRVRTIGGKVETIALADQPRSLAVSADFLYWVALGKTGDEALWVGRKRGVYEPAVLPTGLARLGAAHCIQGACAFIDLEDGTVNLVEQDGSASRKLTAPTLAMPGEVWLGEREVLWTVPGQTGSIGAVARDGTNARVLATAEFNPRMLRADGEDACWIATSALHCVARSGGEVRQLAENLSSFAFDGARIVFADRATGIVAAVPRTGGEQTPLAEGEDQPEFITVDRAAILWNAGGALRRVPKE